ncbi:MAG: hypothetical protein APF76_00360 [Desulfitibacter sp. BRH_c19]|nr:MAG: hypothetical protein APF76_00360 [Desulfitibacter sp. BRH_c19]
MNEGFITQLMNISEEDQVEKVHGNVVFFPYDTGEVSAVLKLAYENGIQIFVQQKPGNRVEQHSGKLVINLAKMDTYFEIDKENLTASVHTGITLDRFQSKLLEEGLYFPPVSIWDYDAFVATAIATNAVGINSGKYGRWREYVVGMEAVLSSGELIELGGKIIKYVSGLDLMSLFIGSQNQLGIVSKVTVRLLPKPEAKRLLVCRFASLADAVAATDSLTQRGLAPARNEILSPKIADKMEFSGKSSGQFVVLTEVEGFYESLSRQVAEIEVAYKKFAIETATIIEHEDQIYRIWQKYFDAADSYKSNSYYNITILPSELPSLMGTLEKTKNDLDIDFEAIIHTSIGNIELFVDIHDIDKLEEFKDSLMKVVLLLAGKVASKKIGVGSHISTTEKLEEGLRVLFDPKQILAGKGGGQ